MNNNTTVSPAEYFAGKSADSDVGYVNRIWNEHLTGDSI